MFRFIVPFNYLYLSRLKSRLEVYSIIWIYPLYLFVFIFFFYEVDLIPGVYLFLLILISWMSIYEIGYLENDTITIKKEKEPNIRIDVGDISFIQTHFRKIVASRIIITLVFMGLIYLGHLLSLNQIIFFIAYVGFIRLVFYLHNTIRSRWNIVTYFFLCISKYFIFPILFMGWDFGPEPYLIILFSFPILRTIEHSVKNKYQLVKIQEFVGSLDVFRAAYYSLCLAIVCIGYVFFELNVNWVYSILYFFIFRFGVFILIKSGIYSRPLG